jgi:anti-anti-sigma factor
MFEIVTWRSAIWKTLVVSLKRMKEVAMSIAVKFSGTVANIVLSGGVDYATQDEFKNANRQALSAQGVREVHVNFAEATFLDSSGIRALLILKKEADAVGKSLVLLNCNDYLRDIFEIGGFDKIFTFR